ncbi:hypothetical protein ELI02_02080 [Rhizobium leguminosarum]|uniref:hypothetical protein n=1 Tax=Rhizobium leguminosarum TaxID=384 RepID=UPI00103016F6|nr:hypothetical protein [Rhizobium leguminosarum]TAX58908.1 hypothetical protein ELI02_02080 [Rhizobium leguminosarum]
MGKRDKEERPSGAWEIVKVAIDACRQQLLQCERTSGVVQDHDGNYMDDEDFIQQAEYLAYLLRKAHVKMQLLIEKAGFVHYLAEYKSGFAAFTDLTDLKPINEEPDYLVSDPLDYIDTAYSSLNELVIGLDDYQLELGMVRRILNNTPYIVEDFKADPHKENDIKLTLVKYLQNIFPSTRAEVKIGHVFKKYSCDIGIDALKALIEVKYAMTETELKAELDGIYADMKGYAGDDRWVHFFALIYTTKPIAAPERLLAEYKLSRVDMSWTPIIVHGTGDRVKTVNPSRSPRKRDASGSS